jgi:2-hydroxy-3-oxopropionate reductase
MLRVGSVGLGLMGAPISLNVLKKLPEGSQLTVWNRTAAKAEPLVAAGAKLAATPRDVAAASDIILTNVTNSADVFELVTREDGLLAGMAKGSIIVDHSTITPDMSRTLAKLCAERGCTFIDAPVSGGQIGARNGQLAIMVGTDDAAALERAKPVMGLYAKSITHIGGSGAGQICKCVNQIIVSAQMTAMGEALVFAAKNGLDAEQQQRVVQAVKGGAAAMWSLDVKPQRLFAGDRSAQFQIKDNAKDLKIVLDTAMQDNVRASMPVTALNMQLFQDCMAHDGEAFLDNSAVIAALERMNNVRIGPAAAAESKK